MLTLAEKNAWLAALRSGEFKQGSGYLKVERSYGTYYCCLGVLCEILRVDLKKGPNGVFRYTEKDGTILSSSLPVEVCTKTGLEPLGNFVGSAALSCKDPSGDALAYWNDTGKSFYEIAGFLEVNLLTEG